MDYLNGRTSDASASTPTTPKEHHVPSKMFGKEQYSRLLNEGESDTIDLDDVVPFTRQRPSYLFYLPSAILFIVAVIMLIILATDAAIFSTSVVDLSRLLSNNQFDVANHYTGSSLATGPSSITTAKPTGEEFGHCGNSVAEARQLGCVFDPMSWAWQRPECYHADLVEEFLSRMDWHFYLTNETVASQEVPYESWVRGDYSHLYGARMWHIFHCSYSWRKFHAAFEKKMPMDNNILSMGHTLHCDTIFLHDFDPKLNAPCDDWPQGCQTTQVNVGYNTCGWY